MTPLPRTIVVDWIDEKALIVKAKANGWTEEESLLDFVDQCDYDFVRCKVFPSITKAKAWARRNKDLDLWNAPDIRVYEYPDARKRSHERECVLHLAYVGDGQGWVEESLE